MEFRKVSDRTRRQNHQALRAQDHSRLPRSDFCYRSRPGFEIAPSPVLAYGLRGQSKASTPLWLFGPGVTINIVDGRVILQGTVNSYEEKRAIFDAVQRAAGSNNLYNEMRVVP